MTADKTTQRTIVRRATKADIPQMVMLGRRFLDETGYPKHGIHGNPAKLHESLLKAVDDDAYGVFVADREGAVMGVAGAIRFTMYFSDTPVGMELFWWMDPDVRGGMTAMRLMQALEVWAVDVGCVTFSMIDIPAITGPAASIYERRGYHLVERTWMKRMSQWPQ